MKKKMVGIVAGLICSVGLLVGGSLNTYAAEQQERVSDGNDSYETARYLDVNGSVTDTIMDSDDVDFFRLNPSANGVIRLSFQHTYQESSHGWYVDLYKYSNGEYQLLSSYVICLSDKETISLPMIGATQGNAYYVKVRSRYSFGSALGTNYTIRSSFQMSEYYEREENGSYADATIMQMNQSYTGTIGIGEDEDFYKITVPSNGKLVVNFKHTYQESLSHGWNVYTYKYEDGEYKCLSSNTILLTDNENIELPFIGATQGDVYFIKVLGRYSFGDAIGEEYAIKTAFRSSEYYEKETNDSYGTATELLLNRTFQGVLNSNEDEDFWKITTTKSGTLGVYFGHTYKDQNYSWNAYVYEYSNGEYKELASTRIGINDNKKSLRIASIPVRANCIYYVKINNYWGAREENYQLKVKYVAEKPGYLIGNTNKRSATLYWESVNGADGYEIYCKKAKGTSYKKIADTKVGRYTYKKLSKKAYTYFKVRSYVMNGNKKTYSKFSYVVKVKA